MEIGTDTSELFTSPTHKNIDVEYNDKIWQFVVRDITWAEKNDIISKSARVKSGKNGEASFDVNMYNQLYLEKSVISAPFEMTRANILQLNEVFGDLLISSIVNKAEKIEEEEAGN